MQSTYFEIHVYRSSRLKIIYVQTVPPHNGHTSGACFGLGGWSTEMTNDLCLAPNLRMSAAVVALLCIFMHACMGQYYLMLPFI